MGFLIDAGLGGEVEVEVVERPGIRERGPKGVGGSTGVAMSHNGELSSAPMPKAGVPSRLVTFRVR
ncbi:hypothetical protein [Streptomyces caniscabiei]|uniref:hypothetical protein n=1 Tax=Streptomyces caniscabiei TaxID=2746961 RepID=UPI0029AA705D|nr:hypothetical protein [Streptomyces caniscabiei]MDX3727113.1 hypothetical protein [Streptomyces caniscabiei]